MFLEAAGNDEAQLVAITDGATGSATSRGSAITVAIFCVGVTSSRIARRSALAVEYGSVVRREVVNDAHAEIGGQRSRLVESEFACSGFDPCDCRGVGREAVPITFPRETRMQRTRDVRICRRWCRNLAS